MEQLGAGLRAKVSNSTWLAKNKINYQPLILTEPCGVGSWHQWSFPGHSRESCGNSSSRTLQLGLGDGFVGLSLPQHCCQVGRGKSAPGISDFSSFGSLGEQTSPHSFSSGGLFPAATWWCLCSSKEKSKESMEKAELGIPERKTKVFPPWPSSASELRAGMFCKAFHERLFCPLHHVWFVLSL